MKTIEKAEIKKKLAEFCEIKGGQNKAANVLRGVSAATVSQILNDKWELISDEMWRSIAAQIGYDARQWTVVETRQFRQMYMILENSQDNAEVYAVIGAAGCGKSEAIKSYVRSHRNVYHLSCGEHWNRRYFMMRLLRCMGIDAAGFSVTDMVDEAVGAFKRKDAPLLVLDEVEKLPDQVLYFFITLYNNLEDHAGIIICATEFLKKRIENGVRCNRKGYREIFSRCGRRFLPLPIVNSEDIAQICIANGVSDPAIINTIIEDSEGDLRCVKNYINNLKKRSIGK